MKQTTLTILLLLSALITFAQENYLEKGNSYLNKQEYAKAEQTFREAIKSDLSNLIYKCQLGLTLIQEKRYVEAGEVLDEVLKTEPNNVAAIWYSGVGNFQNSQDRKAIEKFEKALSLLDKKSPQYYSANWYIGKSYSKLLKTEGLTYTEVDRMFEYYDEYLRLQPNAEDAPNIIEYVARKKKRRAPQNVKVWVDM